MLQQGKDMKQEGSEMRIKGMKSINRSTELLFLIAIASSMLLAGCQSGEVVAEAGGEAVAEADESQQSGWFSFAYEEKATISRGEAITVRLSHGLSSARNHSGDRFQATVDETITLDGKTVVPEGAEVQGTLTRVEDSGRVEGRAEMTLELEEVSLNGTTYSLKAEPLHFQAEATIKEDAKKIGIGTAVGATIGAIAGGGSGAVKGAAIGAGAGTGVVLVTKGKAVELGSEARLVFTLAEAVELPIQK